VSTASQTLGPAGQAAALAFRAIQALVVVLALVWLCSGIRQVPPAQRAVVFRFGRIVRVQNPGLLLAWPRPVETVDLLPGADRQLGQSVTPIERGANALRGAYLTADGGVVLLQAGVVYRITDPEAYVLSREHVPPALDRAFRAAAVGVAARHVLDDFMVTDPEHGAGTVAARQAVLDQLVTAVNARLAGLGEARLGITVERIDITPSLPEAAKRAFDAVLTATQQAEQGIATARTDAERSAQAAAQEQDRLLTDARAVAADMIAAATTETAAIVALRPAAAGPGRGALFDRLWRERVGAILRAAGQVVAVDPGGGTRLILPGTRR
jgi:regulator of protease activity HflC (stomatin/prohibitin superfamily)